MEEHNKVNVKIYGQEFIISGDLPRDQIIKIADYVDRKMHEIAASISSCSTSSLAVLAAVNSADEYFKAARTVNELQQEVLELEKDGRHYNQLWEEAKRNFMQYKEDAQAAIEHKEETQRLYNEKTVEYNQLASKLRELELKNESLQRKNDNLIQRMEAYEQERESAISMSKELEAKCRDLESSFFDLQMENIQLKGELDRQKKIMDQDER